jgi:hypothetical protein
LIFHGIDFEYVLEQYPVLSPRLSVNRKNKTQLEDRRHLIEQFGLEPVHLLESCSDYSMLRCIRECLEFGDSVFAFRSLPLPVWRLSQHELGVSCLDLRRCCLIVTCNDRFYSQLRTLFDAPVLICKRRR